MKPFQALVFALYLPLLAALGQQTAVAGWVLWRGQAAGLYVLLYAAVLAVLARRVLRIGKGRVEAGAGDAAVAGLADVLLAFLLIR